MIFHQPSGPTVSILLSNIIEIHCFHYNKQVAYNEMLIIKNVAFQVSFLDVATR